MPAQGKGSADTLSELSMASTAAPSSSASGSSQGCSSIDLKTNTDHKLARVVLQLRALKLHQESLQGSTDTSEVQCKVEQDSSEKIKRVVQKMKAMGQPQLPNETPKADPLTSTSISNHPVLPDFVPWSDKAT